ncbi:MAG: glycosyltransferase, partial [Planctomycetota bacterium]
MDDAARSSVKQTRDHLTIVYCHNYYQHRGGEDISFERDVKLLRERGHEVIPFIRDNRQLESQSRISLATNTLWNRSIERQFRSLLTEHQPDLVHANNLFPQISVSILATAKRQGIPVVQALRNYRSFCANAFLYRDGKVCTACMTSVLPWSAIRHRCYRGSVGASTVVAAMQVFHRLKKVQQRYVDAFIAPTEFARQVHVEGGFEADRVHVRSNFLDPDPGQ